MFNFFLPGKTRKVLSESELILESLKRNRIYTQDVLTRRDLEAIEALEERYPALLKARDVDALEKLNKEAMKLGNKHFPSSPWDGWRENVEVFVVAAIMALAIRSYFLQPFKIPTGSMEPTLYGIEPKPTKELPPGLPFRIYDFLIHGRTYSRVITKNGGKITELDSGTMTIWFEYTDVHLTDAQGNEEVDRIWIRRSDVEQKLGLFPYDDSDSQTGDPHQKIYQPGDELVNYVTQTGDQVLVDKVTYNFRSPRRGEVFIFKTAGIPKLVHERGPEQEGSEDFIKRCVGLAGDLIQVKPPLLYLQKAGDQTSQLEDGAAAFKKEFGQIDNYLGYTIVDSDQSTGTMDPDGKGQTYYVPADCYWAMGDNSPHSADSRYWGGVPRQNLVGRGYFVFWPFTERWGWIR